MPEKAEHLGRKDMVALSLLARGFKLPPDMCMHLYLCTHRYMYAIEYSFLSYSLSP